MWELRPLATLGASVDCNRDIFTFLQPLCWTMCTTEARAWQHRITATQNLYYKHTVVSGICQWQDNHTSSVLSNDWSLFSVTLPSNIQETKPSNSSQNSWTPVLILQLWMHESLSLLSFTVRCGNKTSVNLCNSCTEHDFMIKYLMNVTFLDTVMLKTGTTWIYCVV
jgi:hypothetical protein